MARHIKTLKNGQKVAIRRNRKKKLRRPSAPRPERAQTRVILANFRKGEEFIDGSFSFE